MKVHGTIFLACTILAAGIAWSAQPAAAQSYNFKNLQIPGAVSTAMVGINNSGAVSGNYVDSGNVTHCALVVGHTVTNINDPNGIGSTCFGLNNQNQVAGAYALAAGFSNGFVYSAQTSTFADIIVPSATAGTEAVGINDLGHVVGFFADNVGTHGFLFDGSNYQVLDVPGAVATLAVGINNRGIVTLQVFTSGGNFASYVYNGRSYRLMNVPGAVNSGIEQINNKNQIAYLWTDAGGAEHGAVYFGHQFIQVDYPGAVSTSTDGINDKGAIIGHYVATVGGQVQTYVGIPKKPASRH